MSLARMMAEEVGYRAKMDAATPGATDDNAALAGAIDQKKVDDALSVLTKYIPTEVIGLYLPGLAAASVAFSADPTLGPKLAYWIFALGVTPLMVLLTYAMKRKAAGQSAWPSLRAFPVWKIVASVLAFMTWALAIPNNPYVTSPQFGVVWGFAALVVSTLLSSFEGLVQPTPGKGSPPASPPPVSPPPSASTANG